MTRSTAAAPVIAMFGAAALAAQTPSPAAPSPPAGATVSLTGCLQPGERTGLYILTHVEREHPASGETGSTGAHHQAPAAPPAPQATPGTVAGPAVDGTVRLAGAIARLKLNDYVGRTVTATGMFAGEDRTVTPGVMLPGHDPERTPEVRGRRPARVFNVRSVTEVARECRK